MGQNNQENLLSLVERLREVGQQEHGIVCNYGEAEDCPANHFPPGPCECGAADHNAAVDAAAKALVDELKGVPITTCKTCGGPLLPGDIVICKNCEDLARLLEKA